MERKTFRILFLLRKCRTGKNGLAPILARITTNGLQSEIYIQCHVSPAKWNQTKERATGNDRLSCQVNACLDDFRARVLEIRQQLIEEGNDGNAIQIKERFAKPKHSALMFLAELGKYCEKRQTEVGVRITQLTANKYHRIFRYLTEYTRGMYGKDDLMLSAVNYEYIDSFNTYLQTRYRCKHNGAVNLLAYNQDKIDRGKGQILGTNRVFVPADGQFFVGECVRDFELSMPPQVTTTRGIVHISLNPHPDDKLTDEQLTDIGREYIKRMGFGGQPWMIFKHEDIDREHLHIVTTRVRGDGTLISDKNNFEKSRRITDDLERKYGLHPKGERQGKAWTLAPIDHMAGDLKKQVGNVIKSLAVTYKFHSLPSYRALLSLYGVGVEKVEGDTKGHRYTGLVYSALDGDGNRVGRPLKSSLFGKSYGIEALERLMTKSGEALKTKGLPVGLRTTVATSLAGSDTGGEFRADLRTKGIDLVFRYGNGGRLFGITFIDHNSRTILNGSALGKDFAANALAERFTDLATESRENKRVIHSTPMVGEDVARSTQRSSADERDMITTPERTRDMSVPSPTPTNEASCQTVWPTQGDHEVAIPRESNNNNQSFHNNDQNPDNTDAHLAIPDLSPIGDAAGSLFSILTPDPGGQTDGNRYVRRIKPPQKKRGWSV